MRSCSMLVFVAACSLAACRPSAATVPPPSASTDAATTEPTTTPALPRDEAGWTEIAAEDGIVVTSRSSEHSPLPVFRGVGVVDASLLEVLAVIPDAPRHQEWIFSCSDSALVEQTSDATGIVYNRTATPWPVPDRDVVLDSRIEVLDGEREVMVRFVATEHPGRPPEDGVVRMTYLQGHYHLWAEGPERTRVEYQVDSDPGGRLPVVLATRGTRDMPLETIRELRAQLRRTQGIYAERIESFRRTVLAAG
ncbi:MAG: START domain-containing protein [Nannocystaceae bacterium]